MRARRQLRATRLPFAGRPLRTGALRVLVCCPLLLAGVSAGPDGADTTASTTAHTAAPGPSVRLTADTELDAKALYFVSYDGLVNNNSFQKSGLLTHQGHQYAAWYTEDRTAVVARRAVGERTWRTVRLPHKLKADDSHNVISMGVSRADGRLHLIMDSHSDGFFSVTSRAGLLGDPTAHDWTADAFGPVTTTLGGLTLTSRFTYPQFIATPEGNLQLSYRSGVSGNGVNALAEYDAATGRWTALGAWSGASGTYASAHGSSSTRNMYLHGIDYDSRGTLHAFYTWREGDASVMCAPGGLSNHDTGYVRSTDRGRTWKDAEGRVVGTTGGRDTVDVGDTSAVADPLGPDHGLMNQEHQATDSSGTPHALISYVPGRFTQCVRDYVADRVAYAHPFHLHREADGKWKKTEIGVPLASSQRAKLAFDRYDNAYAVLPYGRVVGASKASDWTDWKTLYDGTGSGGLNAFGEVVIDETRLARDGVLSVLYQERSSGTTPSPIHVADFALPQ
ncbi:BNR repeat-containing protein [Streptomyces sp. NPDC054796]